jgi:hypothetical protein
MVPTGRRTSRLARMAAVWRDQSAASPLIAQAAGAQPDQGDVPLLSRKLVLLFVICAAAALAPAAHAAPRLRQSDGGPRYYARFSHALPSNPRYFPVGVWFENAETRNEIRLDKQAGLNLYVGVACPECANEKLIGANRMRAIIQSDERTRFDDVGRETAGWLLQDEIDMTDGPPGGDGFNIVQRVLGALPADGRLRYNNYGKGVLLWEDDPWPAQWVNAYQQVVTSDLYWFTDPNQIDMIAPPWLPERGHHMTLSQVRRAANYGYQIDRMRALDRADGRRKPIWAFVEVGWPFTESAAQGTRYIRPAEIRAAVWHSLIAGARGVVYFNHSFGGPEDCQTQHVLRDVGCYAPVRAMVKAVNRQIKRLAPVLNARTVVSGWRSGSSIRAMVKWHRGRFYVFAGSRENRPSVGRFSMRCIGKARAVRLGEAGSVPVRRGSFSDSFADGNAIHIYRIRGGSKCGLARRRGVSHHGARD